MALDRVLHRVSLPFRAVFVVVFAMLVFANLQLLRNDASYEATRELPVRSAILAAAQIANDPAQKLVQGVEPEPHFSPDLTIDDLRRFGAHGELPALHLSLEDVLSAATNLQVGIAETGEDPACAVRPTAQSTLVRASPNGVSLVLNGPPGTAVTFALVDPKTATQGTSRRIVLDTAWSRLTVLRRGVDLSIVVPPGVHVCPVEG